MTGSKGCAGPTKQAWGSTFRVLSTAILMIVSLSSPLCQAQDIKGSAPAAKLSPQQKQAAILARLRAQGKRSPKIINPHAASGASSILAVLRSQKQAADAEQQEMTAANAAMADNSMRPASPAVGPRGPVRGGVAPQSPATVTTPGGKNGPLPGTNKPLLAPCLPSVHTVNGQPSGVSFTPIALYNVYTIKGCGFSNKQGNIYLEIPGSTERIQLTVSQGKGQSAWSDGAIIASLDSHLKGLMDQDEITLVVEPAGGAAIKKPGFKFYAARETIHLDHIPRRVFRPAEPFYHPAIQHFYAYMGYDLESDYVTAAVMRGAPSDNISCLDSVCSAYRFSPGSDYFDFSFMTAGFVTESAQLIAIFHDSMQWDGNNIRVLWNVGSWDFPWESEYGLDVWVNGPIGVDPFPQVKGD